MDEQEQQITIKVTTAIKVGSRKINPNPNKKGLWYNDKEPQIQTGKTSLKQVLIQLNNPFEKQAQHKRGSYYINKEL